MRKHLLVCRRRAWLRSHFVFVCTVVSLLTVQSFTQSRIGQRLCFSFVPLCFVCTVVFSAYRAIVHRFVFFPVASQGPCHLADVQSEAVAGDAEAFLKGDSLSVVASQPFGLIALRTRCLACARLASCLMS